MWIDAHHHLWDPSLRPQTWMDPSWPINRPFDTGDLRAAIEGTPVEATIVVQTEPSIDETTEMLLVEGIDPDRRSEPVIRRGAGLRSPARNPPAWNEAGTPASS